MADRPRVGIVWFRRDLRLADNPTLRRAVTECERIVPLFVVDDRLWPSAPANRRWFLAGCLADLDRQLDGRLVVRHGDPATVISDIVRTHDVARLYRADDAGPSGRRRDAEVDDALLGDGADGRRRSALRRRPRSDCAPRRASRSRSSPRTGDAGARRRSRRRCRLRRPSPSSTASTPMACPNPGRRRRPPGSPNQASGLRTAGWNASSTETSPATTPAATCRPPTPRAASARTSSSAACTPARSSSVSMGGAAITRRSLASWPGATSTPTCSTPGRTLHGSRSTPPSVPSRSTTATSPTIASPRGAPGARGIRSSTPGCASSAAEGFMHNRLRMTVASFLVKDLHLDWRRGARFFSRHLYDGDVASNNHGWQWVAGTGTDAAPYYRVFNPVRQGERFDPDGEYVRRWIPELSDLDAARHPRTAARTCRRLSRTDRRPRDGARGGAAPLRRSDVTALRVRRAPLRSTLLERRRSPEPRWWRRGMEPSPDTTRPKRSWSACQST